MNKQRSPNHILATMNKQRSPNNIPTKISLTSSGNVIKALSTEDSIMPFVERAFAFAAKRTILDNNKRKVVNISCLYHRRLYIYVSSYHYNVWTISSQHERLRARVSRIVSEGPTLSPGRREGGAPPTPWEIFGFLLIV